MERKILSGIMVAFVLANAMLVFSIQPHEAVGTIYINADGSIVPTTSPIQRNGNVYTFTSNINDSIVLHRDNIVVDGAGYTLQGTGSETGIQLLERSNVTIKNVKIKTFAFGIVLINSLNNSVSRNNLTNNCYGIGLERSSKNSISENNLMANYGGGIALFYSRKNIINGNMFIDDGMVVFESFENVVSSNLVNDMPLIYLEGVSDQSVENAGQVILVNCSGIRVENLNISRTVVAVELWRTSNTKIAGNHITANGDAIWLHMSSDKNSVSGNNITRNNGSGIIVVGSSKNDLSGNNLRANNGSGVYLSSYSNGNVIRSNNITASNGGGVFLYMSSNNTVSENNIVSNRYGIWLNSSSNTMIYHNNFVNNTIQVYSDASVNVWDNGYPSGGNYWADYTDVDLYSGPYQNETDSDGIWDQPYVIDANNQDRYPLVNPWTVPLPKVTAAVDICPSTLNLRSKGKWITTFIEIPEGHNVRDIDVSSIRLNGTVPVDLASPRMISNYDGDTIPHLMVKFNRAEIIRYILNSIDMAQLFEERFMQISLTITGTLDDGASFEGHHTIKILYMTPK